MVNNYNDSSIQVLSDVEHIRLRPQMYAGVTDTPHQLFIEGFDNAVDELQSGWGTLITVRVDTALNKYTITDDGRGIPIGKKTLPNGAEQEIVKVLCTKSNSGGKFDSGESRAYLYSGGLHGIGLVLVNALSKSMLLQTERGGQKVTYISETDALTYTESAKRGTTLEFTPDEKYFSDSPVVDTKFIIERCRTCNSFGIKVELYIDNVFTDVASTEADLFPVDTTETSIYYTYPSVYSSSNVAEERMAAFIRYTSDTKEKYIGFTNLIKNSQGGTHVNAISRTIVEAWKMYVQKEHIKFNVELRDTDYLVGIRCVCACFISNPAFSSQTKERLSVDRNYFKSICDALLQKLYLMLKLNKNKSNALLKRFEEYRISQNKLLSRKHIDSLIKVNEDKPDSIRRRSNVPGLIECLQSKRDNTELYLCLHGSTRILVNDANGTPYDIELEKLVFDINNTTGAEYRVPCIGYYGMESGHIVAARTTQKVHSLIKLCFSGKRAVQCTGSHRFLCLKDPEVLFSETDTISDRLSKCIWKEAQDIVLTDIMPHASSLTMQLTTKILTIDKIETVEYDEPVPVYCLEISSGSGLHDYILENGVVTHNCEGLSAAGTVVRTRDKNTQACLPLRGKVMNVANLDVKRALKSDVIRNITNAIGGGIAPYCDPTKRRYDKIMIAADADPDGLHICNLLISTFINLLPELVKEGCIYVIEAPLYGWYEGKTLKTTNELKDIPPNIRYIRWKGLGEMNDSEYKECIMDKNKRRAFRLEYPDNFEAVNTLLGSAGAKNQLLRDLGLIKEEY